MNRKLLTLFLCILMCAFLFPSSTYAKDKKPPAATMQKEEEQSQQDKKACGCKCKAPAATESYHDNEAKENRISSTEILSDETWKHFMQQSFLRNMERGRYISGFHSHIKIRRSLFR